MSDFIALRVVVSEPEGENFNETMIIKKKDIIKIQTHHNIPYINILDHRGMRCEYRLLTPYKQIKKELLDA